MANKKNSELIKKNSALSDIPVLFLKEFLLILSHNLFSLEIFPSLNERVYSINFHLLEIT